MRSLALLRGINVGGKNKVDMATLRETFIRTGVGNVLTYINSGNVIFDDERPHQELASLLEGGIEEDFGLRVKVLLRDIASIRGLATAIPDSWTTDKTMRTNVLFLWEHVDNPDVVDQLPVRDGVDDIMYSPGAIVLAIRCRQGHEERYGAPRRNRPLPRYDRPQLQYRPQAGSLDGVADGRMTSAA